MHVPRTASGRCVSVSLPMCARAPVNCRCVCVSIALPTANSILPTPRGSCPEQCPHVAAKSVPVSCRLTLEAGRCVRSCKVLRRPGLCSRAGGGAPLQGVRCAAEGPDQHDTRRKGGRCGDTQRPRQPQNRGHNLPHHRCAGGWAVWPVGCLQQLHGKVLSATFPSSFAARAHLSWYRAAQLTARGTWSRLFRATIKGLAGER